MPVLKPADWYQPTFFPQNFLSATSIALGNKVLGLKNMYSPEISHQAVLAKGWTHLMNPGTQTVAPYNQTNVGWGNQFTLMKYFFNSMNTHVTDSGNSWFYDSGKLWAQVTEYNVNQYLTGEILEEFYNTPGYVDPEGKAIAFYQGYTDEMASQGKGMDQHRCYGDYDGVVGVGNVSRIEGSTSQRDAHINAMSTQTLARKYYDPSMSSFVSTDTFYSTAKSSAHHVLHQMYYRRWKNQLGYWIPQLIFSMERMYLAHSNRKQSVFAWELIEEMEGLIVGFLTSYDYLYTSPAGKLTLADRPTPAAPPELMGFAAFFSLLLGEGMVNWSDTEGVKNVPAQGHDKRLFDNDTGQASGNRRSWTTGSGTVNWSLGDSSMPQFNAGNTNGFIGKPMTAIDAIHQYAGIYAQIKDRVTTSLRWAKFSSNGGSSYTTPVSGSLGAEVSKYGAANFGQHNIVLRCHDRKGIALFGTGSAGKVCIYYNPFLLSNQTEQVRIEENGQVYNLGAVHGCTLHVETFA
jgi:hypothetical protein